MTEPNNIVLIAEDNRPERRFYADIIASVLGKDHIYEALNDERALGFAAAKKEYCLGCIIGRHNSMHKDEEIKQALSLADRLNESGLRYDTMAMISPIEELFEKAGTKGIKTYLAINAGDNKQQIVNRKNLIQFLVEYTLSLEKSSTFSKAA